MNLQLWGLPTSKPAYDPNNHEFIYQRFQRGVMHYDRGCRCTQGLLLADYLKDLLTGVRLPDDLAAQAAGSPLSQGGRHWPFAPGNHVRRCVFGANAHSRRRAAPAPAPGRTSRCDAPPRAPRPSP